MNSPIKTNKLNIQLDITTFTKEYDVFRIETSDDYIKYDSLILDEPQTIASNTIRSVFYDAGKSFYIMMCKGPDNRGQLQKIINDTYSIHDAPAQKLDKRVLVSLLLNALSSYDSKSLQFNNLTGHFYCTNPKWIKKTKQGKIYQVYGLEFGITNQFHLSMHVRTFTSELMKDYISMPKGKTFYSYPQYVFSKGHTLRRKLLADKGVSFINRQLNGQKNTIKFLNVSKNIASINNTKMMALAKVITTFNDTYDGICHLSFEPIYGYETLETRLIRPKKGKYEQLSRLLQPQNINIVDMVQENISDEYCERIKALLLHNFSCNATISTEPVANSLNLCLTYEKEYYAEYHLDDPYSKNFPALILQHLTIDLKANDKELSTQLYACLSELLIKQDIMNGIFSLFNWNQLGLTEDITFGLQVKSKDEQAGPRYFFMTVQPAGGFTLSEERLNFFTGNEYNDTIFALGKDNNAVGSIRIGNQETQIIRDTNLFTVPEIEKLKYEAETNPRSLRSKKNRDEYLTSVTEIRSFKQGNHTFYFIGESGSGMDETLNCAANIRELYPIKEEDSPFSFEQLLPLMTFPFVQKGRLTVIPFPFKYLREYAAMKMREEAVEPAVSH